MTEHQFSRALRATDKSDSASPGPMESAVGEIVRLVGSMFVAAVAMLVWLPAWLPSFGLRRGWDLQSQRHPLAYLLICSFVFAAFWPLSSINLFSGVSADEVARVLKNLSVDISVPRLLVDAASVFLPILACAKLAPIALLAWPSARARIEGIYCYVFGTQLLLLPLFSALHWSLPLNVLASGGIPLWVGVHVVFALHPFPVLVSEMVRVQRTGLLGTSGYLVWLLTISSAVIVPGLAIQTKALAATVRASSETPPPRPVIIRGSWIAPTAEGVEMEMLVYLWNGSDIPLYYSREIVFLVPSAGHDPRTMTYAQTPMPTVAVSWSGPPGPLLVVQPTSGGWMQIRGRHKSPELKALVERQRGTDPQDQITLGLACGELGAIPEAAVTFSVLRTPP